MWVDDQRPSRMVLVAEQPSLVAPALTMRTAVAVSRMPPLAFTPRRPPTALPMRRPAASAAPPGGGVPRTPPRAFTPRRARPALAMRRTAASVAPPAGWKPVDVFT